MMYQSANPCSAFHIIIILGKKVVGSKLKWSCYAFATNNFRTKKTRFQWLNVCVSENEIKQKKKVISLKITHCSATLSSKMRYFGVCLSSDIFPAARGKTLKNLCRHACEIAYWNLSFDGKMFNSSVKFGRNDDTLINDDVLFVKHHNLFHALSWKIRLTIRRAVLAWKDSLFEETYVLFHKLRRHKQSF